MVRKISIKSKLENVSGVCSLFTSDLSVLALPEKVAGVLELSLAEVLTNVVKHAYPEKDTGEIGVIYSCDENLVAISITDTGVSNDKPIKKDLDFNVDDRDQLPEFGMGLFLVNQIMDEVTYTKEGDRNILTMKKYLAKE